MATEPSYLYVPFYGIEEYDALGVPSSDQVGGGAKLTHDNLLITLWSEIVFDSDTGFPIGGDLVKPGYAFGGDWFSQFLLGPRPPGQNFINLPNVGWKSEMRSRVASKFYLDAKAKDDINYPFVAFLRPPNELRQMLAGALALDDDGNVVYKKSQVDNFIWDAKARLADIEGSFAGEEDLLFSASGVFAEFPYYVGDGSNGVFPTPLTSFDEIVFGPASLTQKQALIEALKTGNFTVMASFFPSDTQSPHVYTVEWPHSIARS